MNQGSKHTYILKSCKYNNHTETTMLLQDNQPWISNPRTVILDDARNELSPDVLSFIEDCYDKKITGTQEQPAVFQNIQCFWDNLQFCIKTGLIPITYTLMTEDDNDVVFMIIAKRYCMGMQTITTMLLPSYEKMLFQTYEEAKHYVDDIKAILAIRTMFHQVDILVKRKRDL